MGVTGLGTQPDNLVVCGKLEKTAYLSKAPILIFEILSKSTAHKGCVDCARVYKPGLNILSMAYRVCHSPKHCGRDNISRPALTYFLMTTGLSSDVKIAHHYANRSRSQKLPAMITRLQPILCSFQLVHRG